MPQMILCLSLFFHQNVYQLLDMVKRNITQGQKQQEKLAARSMNFWD